MLICIYFAIYMLICIYFALYMCIYINTHTEEGHSQVKNIIDQVTVKVNVAQSCLTLCNPIDCTVHGILQARILEWVALPFSRGSSQTRD